MMLPALALLRRLWWALPIAALAVALLATRARLADARQTLANERAAWSAEIMRADAQRLAIERDNAARSAAAALDYAGRLAAREPIILRSTNTVREYVQTDAGRVVCLPADRVQPIQADRDALFADDPATAGDGNAGVLPGATGAAR